MRRRLAWPAMIVILLMATLTTACSPQRTQRIANGIVGVAVRFMPKIGLPRMVVKYNETGVPSIFRIRTTTIQRILPINLGFLQLQPATLDRLRQNNIQHIELEINDQGLFVYGNGEGFPYLGWTTESLALVGSFMDQLDVMAPYDTTIARALPLLQRIGIDIVIVFPPAEGTQKIPVRKRAERAIATGAPIEEPTAILDAHVVYTPDGVPTLVDLTTRDLQGLVDLSSIELTPATLDLMKQAGIQQLLLTSEPDGLHLLVNDQELLHVAYTAEHLVNAAEFYDQLSGKTELGPLWENLAPILYGADIDVVIDLPTGE